MHTLLIVDDEEIEREGMAQFIPWDTYEMKVVGTARNGAEGLEKIAKYKPDLAIVDPVLAVYPEQRHRHGGVGGGHHLLLPVGSLRGLPPEIPGCKLLVRLHRHDHDDPFSGHGGAPVHHPEKAGPLGYAGMRSWHPKRQSSTSSTRNLKRNCSN